jgi:hypothetical protein
MDAQLEKLKEALLQTFKAPDVYMFKFIVPNDNISLAKVMNLFDEGAEVNSRGSKSGKYMSITAREMMMSVDSIIEKYERAFQIQGLMAI